MTATLVVSGRAADRLKAWGLQPGGSGTKADHQAAAGSSDLPVGTCAVIPPLLGGSLQASQSEARVLNRNLALYAPIRVLRRLGVYDGSLVQVSNASSLQPSRQIARIYATASTSHPRAAGRATDAVQLSPLLAYNLRLQHKLQPFLTEQALDSGDSSADSQACAVPPLDEPGCASCTLAVNITAVKGSSDAVEGPKPWLISQPGQGTPTVAVAHSVSLGKIAIPQQQLFASGSFKPEARQTDQSSASGGTGGDRGGNEAAKAEGDLTTGRDLHVDAASEDMIEDLKAHLQQQRHIIALEDVIAVPRRQLGPQDSLLHSLYGLSSLGSIRSLTQLLFFKVMDLQPANAGPLGLDPAQTDVRLQGSCKASLPVGLQRYTASLQELLHLTSTHASSGSQQADSQSTPDSNSGHSDQPQSTTAAQSSYAPLESQDGSRDEDARGLTERRRSHALAGSLGWDAGAAWQPEHASLPGLGALMPTWHHVARILAPIFHQGSAAFPLRAALLVHGPLGSGKATAVKAACVAMGLHLVPYGCAGLHAGTQSVAPSLRAAFEAAQHFAPGVLLLTGFEALAGSSAEAASNPASHEGEVSRLTTTLEELTHPPACSDSSSGQQQGQAGRMIIVACCQNMADVPPTLRRCFTHEIAAEAPDADMRSRLLKGFLGRAACQRLGPDRLQDLAAHSAGLMPRDLAGLVADAGAAAVMQDRDVWSYMTAAKSASSAKFQAAGITEQHLSDALAGVRKRTATAIGAPQVPNVRWDDVGGLEHIKRTILDTVELPLKHPSLFAAGLRRRSGILLYGPPGTGKTLVAKAVATECAINFLSVKGPELINMYIGESERQVREIFAKARRARPCILFFDELDSLAPARGAGADSGGVMDRVVAQLLAELDGAQSPSDAIPSSAGNDIFVIGATNRPDLLDVALMRPGRLDKLLYVGVAEDPSSKVSVLTALTRKFRLAEDVNLTAVARECAVTFTGADMYALAADAWTSALKRLVAENAADEAEDVQVSQTDFWTALKGLTPSLSAAELQRYKTLQQQYAEGQ